MVSLPIFLPLLSFFICLSFSKITSHKILSLISCFIISLSAILSLFLMINIAQSNDDFSIFIFKWIASGDLLSNWSIHIDFFSAIMISTVNIVSALVQIYSIEHMKEEKYKTTTKVISDNITDSNKYNKNFDFGNMNSLA